jgi:RNA polymerase sigma-70 factor (ECF subfamily)
MDDYSLHQLLEDQATPTPPGACLQAELEQRLEQALAALPESQRTAIMLCRQQELSYEQIAEILDCSVSATKSLIHRARETLRQRLKPYLRTGEWQAHSASASPKPGRSK